MSTIQHALMFPVKFYECFRNCLCLLGLQSALALDLLALEAHDFIDLNMDTENNCELDFERLIDAFMLIFLLEI